MPTVITPSGQPFVVHDQLTRIAMAVMNEMMIADEVCPRVPVEGEKFTYTKVTTKERLQVPDTRIGRTAHAHQVEFGSTDETDRIEDYGLEAPVPQRDIEAAASGANQYDPLATATETAVDLMDLAREVRVAGLVFTAANYATGYKLTLDGTAGKYQWDDYANSNPAEAIVAAMDGMVTRPNTVVMNQKTWSKVKFHPSVVKKAHGVIEEGSVTLQEFAAVLEVERVLVGKAWRDTAAKGQAMSTARVWGNQCALLRLEPGLRSARTARPSFCFTAEWEGRMAGTYFDPAMGSKGCQVPKVVDQIKELISWQTAGYLFSDVLATP